MTITRVLSVAALLITLAPFDVGPASAQTANCRPWCVYYGGGGGRGGGTNCGFTSYEQCMWTAQGSDICMPNGFCPPAPGAKGGPPGYGAWGQQQGYPSRQRY